MAIPLIVSSLARAAGTYLAKKGAKKAVKGLAKRQAKKKRNETPQTGMKSVTLNSNRTIAKDYKASTGKSFRTVGEAKPEGSKFSKLTSTTKKQQAPETVGAPGTYKSPTKRFNTKDMQRAVQKLRQSVKK